MKRKVICSLSVSIVTLMGISSIINVINKSPSADASTSGLTMSATINPSSTITINADSVNLDITPSASGTLKSSDALTVSAYTNTNYDCNVTMTASSSSLVSGANSIPTLATGTTYTDATFTNDSWGYKIGTNGEYKSVLAGEGANAIKTISSMTGGTANTTDIFFAAKLTPATKPGTYTNTVTFASTCTPPPISDISELTYMQDFATLTSSEKSDVLDSMTTGNQYQLKDNRDQKEYYISKLADGNVWMTQNLDHNIVTTAGYYTPQNTDIPSAWTPSTATFASGTTTWDKTATGRTTPQSYDPGDLCWDGTINWDLDGKLDNETTTCGSDKHMHIGNYYNWTAAVAMNDSSSYTAGNTDVDQSICPAGWMLPKSGTNQTGSKSFRYLWDQYSSSFDEYTMMNSPLYFSYVGYWNGSSRGVGSYDVYWSSVVSDSNNAYGLYFEMGFGPNPQSNASRNDGNSVRCVAR